MSAPKRVIFYTPDRKKKVFVSSPVGSVLLRVFLAAVVVNLAILNFLLLRENLAFNKARDAATQSAEMMVSETTAAYKEIERLKREFENKIASAEAKFSYSYLAPTSVNYTPLVPVSKDFKHRMEYISFSGGKRTSSTSWWIMPGMEVSFNIADYPRYTAWWEAHLRVKDGAGKAHARIFDSFANIPIEGSEIETSSGELVQVSSGPLKFYLGDRTYKIQAKSLYGTEAVVESAKIRISWIEE